MRRLSFAALALLAAMLLLAACGGSDEKPKPTNTPVPPSATPRPTSTPVVVPEVETDPTVRGQFRVIDASTDLPTVNIYLNAALIGSQFSAGSYTAQPLTFGAGTYTLRVVAVDAEADAPPLLDYELTLEAGESQILLLGGTPDEPAITRYDEDLSGLSAGTARISAIDATPGSEPFDVWLGTEGLFSGVEFDAPAGPATLDAGSQHIEFRRGVSVFRAMDVQLGERVAYTFVLVGTDEDSEIITLQSQVQLQAEVRIIHAAQGVPAVDVLLDDEPVASGLAYGTWTDWVSSLAQSRTLRVVPAGGGDPLYEAPLALRPDRPLDVILIGEPDEVSVAQVQEDRSPTPGNAARMVFINAVPHAARVEVTTSSGPVEGVLTLNYGFGSAPITVIEKQGAYVFNNANVSSDLVGRTDDTHWAAGHAYTLIATGDESGRPLVLDSEVGTNDTVVNDYGAIAPSDAGMEHYRIRIINARSEGGAVDVDLGGQPAAAGTDPGMASAYAEIPRGAAVLTVRDTQSGDTLLQTDYEPPADVTEATLFVYGEGDAVQVVTASDNAYGSLADQAWLRVFHANPNQPDLQLSAQGPADVDTSPSAAPTPAETPLPPEAALVDLAQYGLPTDPITLQPGTYRVHILNAANDLRIYTDPLVTLKAGAFYDLLILPDPTGLSIELALIPRE